MPGYPQYGYGYPPGYYPPNVPDPTVQMRQNQYQQPQPVPAVQPSMSQPSPILGNSQNGIIWVQSKEEADRFMVTAGSAVALWDANNPVIYLRQADSTGKPSTTVYDLVERTDAPPAQPAAPPAPQVDLSQYIKRSEVEDIKNEIDNLWDKLESIQDRMKRPAKSTKSKEESSNE